MPIGVEHHSTPWRLCELVSVLVPVMPIGVEHQALVKVNQKIV